MGWPYLRGRGTRSQWAATCPWPPLMGQGPGQSKVRGPSAVGPHGLQSRFWFPEPAPTWIQRGSVWLLLAQAVPATSQGPLILLPHLPHQEPFPLTASLSCM